MTGTGGQHSCKEPNPLDGNDALPVVGLWFQTWQCTSSGVRAVLPPFPVGKGLPGPLWSCEHKGIGAELRRGGAAPPGAGNAVCSLRRRDAPAARSRLARRSRAVTATKLVTPVTKQSPRLLRDICPPEQGWCAWGGLLLGGQVWGADLSSSLVCKVEILDSEPQCEANTIPADPRTFLTLYLDQAEVTRFT